MNKIISKFSLFCVIMMLMRCGGGGDSKPIDDFGDTQHFDVQPAVDMGRDLPKADVNPDRDLGTDANLDSGSDTSDSGPDVAPIPRNAPRFPKTFVDLYGEIINHQNTDPSNFTPSRLTIVEGRVLDDKKEPLVNVKIFAPEFPGFGHVLSDINGNFSFALNGGGVVNLRYTKIGFIEAERRVQSLWNEFVQLGPVVLKEYSKTVTPISFSNANQIQVARGDIESDFAGDRQATLLVNSNTNASLRLKDGTSIDMPTLNLRFTEFTVGSVGPLAMPGNLPGTSAYTYALEISADEAVAMDAVSVEFDKPVYFYVDDFIGFPVGTIVPIGYYSREKHAWIPSDNGKVISIISVSNGKAAVDIDGDGAADSGALLTDLGFTDEELTELASLYTPGKVVWRGPMTHLTPWDHNFPFGPPEGARGPNYAVIDEPVNDPCEAQGSVIECESKVLRETIEVPGTPFGLTYSSYNAKFDAANQINIPLITPGANPDCVEVTVDVAGRRYSETFANVVPDVFEITWDGRDKDGNVINGQQNYKSKVTNYYELVYYETAAEQRRAFAKVSERANGIGANVYYDTAPGSCDLDGRVVELENEFNGVVGRLIRGQDLAGWTLTNHHAFDSNSKTIHLGDGSRYISSPNELSIRAGDGTQGALVEGAISTQQPLYSPTSILEIKSDGTLVSDYGAVGLQSPSHHYVEYRSDGRTYLSPALEFDGNAIRYNILKVGADDSVYLSDNRRLFKEKDGVIYPIINPLAGSLVAIAEFAGDAISANLGYIQDLVVGLDGTVYVLSFENLNAQFPIVWRVSPDGFVSRLYGSYDRAEFIANGLEEPSASGSQLKHLLLDTSDRLYFVERRSVYRFENDGKITTILGGGSTSFTSGMLATDLSGDIRKPRLDRKDRLYFYIPDGRLIRIEDDGTLNFVAGRKLGFSREADFFQRDPQKLKFNYLDAVFNHKDEWLGLFSLAVYGPQLILRLQNTDSSILPSESGEELYIFDEKGKHLETRNTLTGNLIYEFSYDTFDRLLSITDIDGLKTSIERDIAGDPLAIIGPYGHRNIIELNDDYLMKSMSNANNETVHITYKTNGLIQALTDPKGHAKTYRFDLDGRLTGETDAAGSKKTFGHDQSVNSLSGSVTSEMGRKITHAINRQNPNAITRTSTGADGFQIKTEVKPDQRTIEYPDGRKVSLSLLNSPTLGLPYINEINVTYPSGRSITSSTSQDSVSGVTATDGVLSFVATKTLGNATMTSTYDRATKTTTSTSPEGRISYSKIDDKGRVIESGKAGLLPTFMDYDADGRLTTITQGARSSTFGYDAKSNVDRVTDALSRSVDFGFDDVGRTISQSLPDGRTHNFAFDSNGNISTVQPAARDAHSFDYNAVNQATKYSPPVLQSVPNPSTGQSYNLDHQPTKTTLADGREINIDYDLAGRLASVTGPLGVYTTNYSTLTGQLESVDGLAGGSLAFEYDGDLVTKTTNTQEEVSGIVDWTYDSSLRVASQKVNGKSTAYFYDRDGGLIRSGALTLTRDPQTGFVTDTTVLSVLSSITFNGYGELDNQHFTYNGSDLFEVQHTYNNIGQITDRTETIEGVSKSYAYSYDVNDRLTNVFEDGVLVEEFTFDDNENVSERKTNGVTTIATFDEQDRLISRGTKLYRYNDHGQLNEIADNVSGDLTNLDYDVFGSLRQVSMPDGTIVDYIIDANGRRVGKRVNGTFVKGWVYGAGLRPIAEVDNVGNVELLFVYGTSGTVPAYIVKGNTTYRVITDHLGSVRMIVNATTGVIEQQISYDVYGKKTLDTNPGLCVAHPVRCQPFGFAGGLHDIDTGFVQFSARDYDPESARWMSKDPAGFNGENTNLYGYVNGDPINYTDPTGRVPVDTFVDIASIAYDIYRIFADNIFGDCDNLGTNLGALGMDVLGLVIPYAAGLGMAYRAAKAAKKLDKLNDLRKVNKGCFVADTPVVVCDPDDEEWSGTQPIETIQAGDFVLSKDERSGKLSCEEVSAPTIIPDQEIFRVITRNVDGESNEIEATGNHPFFANGRWTRADELGPGDIVESRGDDLEVVVVKRTERFETVYNFTVSNYHTYFVGDDATWVHNTKTCKLPRFDGPKPKYDVNEAHVPGMPGFRPNKTPLPNDAEEVFKTAIPNSSTDKKAVWFGKNSDGKIYRFSNSNDGTAHFSGIDGVGDGIRNLSPYGKARLKGLK